MPGTLLAVNVRAGDVVNRGQPLCALEAIKMMNSIRSPRDGVIAEVPMQPEQAMGCGCPLLRFVL